MKVCENMHLNKYIEDVSAFYNNNADNYFEKTKNIDMYEAYNKFLQYIPAGGHILDVGCGSGRDLRYFKNNNYVPEGLDISKSICKIAEKYSGCKVYNDNILTINSSDFDKYDGVWACASLLHIKYTQLPLALDKISNLLNSNGYVYLSFKHGNKEYKNNKNLQYTDMSSVKMIVLLAKYKTFKIIEEFYTSDGLAREKDWYNVILQKRN